MIDQTSKFFTCVAAIVLSVGAVYLVISIHKSEKRYKEKHKRWLEQDKVLQELEQLALNGIKDGSLSLAVLKDDGVEFFKERKPKKGKTKKEKA